MNEKYYNLCIETAPESSVGRVPLIEFWNKKLNDIMILSNKIIMIIKKFKERKMKIPFL